MKFSAEAAKIRSNMYKTQIYWDYSFLEDQIKQASTFGIYSIYIPGQAPLEFKLKLIELGYEIDQHHAGLIIFWGHK